LFVVTIKASFPHTLGVFSSAQYFVKVSFGMKVKLEIHCFGKLISFTASSSLILKRKRLSLV